MAKKKPRKRQPRKNKKHQVPKKIDVDQILLEHRQLFLFEPITAEVARDLIKKMVALDRKKVAPIALYINSPGGRVNAGFAIIDSINGINSPVITIIVGMACSMAGILSVVGEKRFMTEHSVWMSHDIAGGVSGSDYTSKTIDRVEFMKLEQKKCEIFLAKHTKLTPRELTKARNGELWLTPDECLKKGVIEEIIK